MLAWRPQHPIRTDDQRFYRNRKNISTIGYAGLLFKSSRDVLLCVLCTLWPSIKILCQQKCLVLTGDSARDLMGARPTLVHWLASRPHNVVGKLATSHISKSVILRSHTSWQQKQFFPMILFGNTIEIWVNSHGRNWPMKVAWNIYVSSLNHKSSPVWLLLTIVNWALEAEGHIIFQYLFLLLANKRNGQEMSKYLFSSCA